MRDLSARALAEFLRYAVKQRSKAQVAQDALQVGALLRRLASLLRHPSAHKRLGALGALTHMYRDLREESTLVDAHAMSLLHTALECMA